ncbi:MAG: hypothetical protein WDO19_02065 [Bacteroidota bacterium]
MKTRFAHIIAIFFVSLFLAKGITALLYSPVCIADKIAVNTDTETEDQETGKNAPEKESALFYEKPVNIIPSNTCFFLKERISSHPGFWRNIILPVFTPPPEIA